MRSASGRNPAAVKSTSSPWGVGGATCFNKKDHLWTLYEYETGAFKIPETAREGMIYGGCNCGSCAEHCTQRCIEPGMPYRIQQEHCLHCGNCQVVCPVQAAEKR